MLTRGWNRAVEQQVVAVTEPADVDETVAVIRRARRPLLSRRLARLRDIKRRYDPGNLFRGNFPVGQ